eukprot:TRINITY_DN124_c0_g1_i1.p1 TRINITY_DN124_c0_g1~~TRINITY_DN124_c0_g1_i1.p1  ORF type:complete len:364 (+),score=48.25 TRINITY_DN124_c0_g1_i1:114-1205(+)
MFKTPNDSVRSALIPMRHPTCTELRRASYTAPTTTSLAPLRSSTSNSNSHSNNVSTSNSNCSSDDGSPQLGRFRNGEPVGLGAGFDNSSERMRASVSTQDDLVISSDVTWKGDEGVLGDDGGDGSDGDDDDEDAGRACGFLDLADRNSAKSKRMRRRSRKLCKSADSVLTAQIIERERDTDAVNDPVTTPRPRSVDGAAEHLSRMTLIPLASHVAEPPACKVRTMRGASVDSIHASSKRAIHDILIDAPYRALYMQFLKNEHSEENLMFWTDVERFRSIVDDEMPFEDILAEAGRIYAQYVNEGSVNQVNLQGNMSRGLKRLLVMDLQRDDLLHMYDRAQKCAEQTMAMDSLPRFFLLSTSHG